MLAPRSRGIRLERVETSLFGVTDNDRVERPIEPIDPSQVVLKQLNSTDAAGAHRVEHLAGR